MSLTFPGLMSFAEFEAFRGHAALWLPAATDIARQHSLLNPLSENEKEGVLRQIGELIAEVQSVPPGPLLELEPRWPGFLRAQLDECHARHARQGLPPPLLDELSEYLSRAPESLG
jgi:hypothetical protein